jgi:hypothetical protein
MVLPPNLQEKYSSSRFQAAASRHRSPQKLVCTEEHFLRTIALTSSGSSADLVQAELETPAPNSSALNSSAMVTKSAWIQRIQMVS